jgi:hyperosmotically inducible protein
MHSPALHTLSLVGALVAAAALSACEKTTVTTQSPGGATTTTTTIGPSASVAQGMARAGDVLADAALTAKVKAALIADPDVDAGPIDVDTKDGVVHLRGSAQSQARLDRAVAIAKGIDGVKSVESELKVDPSIASASAPTATGAITRGASEAAGRAGDVFANGVLTAKVKTALLADERVKGLQIDVDASDGVVTLSGAVDSAATAERAQTIARGIEGVKSVESRLAVKSP